MNILPGELNLMDRESEFVFVLICKLLICNVL